MAAISVKRSIHLLSNSSPSQLHGFLHETRFPRYKFFTSYFIDGRVFFRVFTFLSYSTICFCIDWVRVYRYTKSKGLHSSCIISKEPKRDKHGASLQSSPRINRMLTTRLISIAGICGPTRFGKSGHFSHLTWMALWKIFICRRSRRDLITGLHGLR